jgi:hypothetical protein
MDAGMDIECETATGSESGIEIENGIEIEIESESESESRRVSQSGMPQKCARATAIAVTAECVAVNESANERCCEPGKTTMDYAHDHVRAREIEIEIEIGCLGRADPLSGAVRARARVRIAGRR